MREKNPDCPNFLDKKHGRFKRIQGTLDAYFHKLHAEVIGRHVKHAETISSEEENQLWDSGVMNTHTPIGLQSFLCHWEDLSSRWTGTPSTAVKLSQLQRDTDK